MVLTKTRMLRLQNRWVTFQQVQPSFIYSLWCHLCLCCYSQKMYTSVNNVVFFCVSSDCNCVNCQKSDKLIKWVQTTQHWIQKTTFGFVAVRKTVT